MTSKNVVGVEILELLESIKPNLDERCQLSLMLHFIVFENQLAVFDLVERKLFHSASALLRVQFEAHVKAEWLKECASDKQVEQFKRDRVKSSRKPSRDIRFNELVDELELVKPHLKGTMKSFQAYHWKGLNSFTHVGSMQLTLFQRILSGEDIDGESYVDFANRFAINSLGGVAVILEDAAIMKGYISLSRRFLNIPLVSDTEPDTFGF
ncbi:conserved hypothetical protein [Vibrio chagasii]|nr:conserved hypothetical protein [Vibrio chagasii]CAH7443614.1 conserved hypothetical protein [Vibrio chagasii]